VLLLLLHRSRFTASRASAPRRPSQTARTGADGAPHGSPFEGLTPTQEAEHLSRRKDVWEAMRSVVSEESGATCTTLPGTGRGNTQFASETAAVTGKDKSTINRAIRRATEVCQAARDLIPNASASKADTTRRHASLSRQLRRSNCVT